MSDLVKYPVLVITSNEKSYFVIKILKSKVQV